MIKENVFEFLAELEVNNNREWFTQHKQLYNSAFNDMLKVVEYLIPKVGAFDPDIKNLDAKKCMFRIYRDVRFSKDKAPYKQNFGGFLVKGGRNSGNAGYYLHIENNNSFIAGGIYMPPAPVLKKVRQEIYYHVDEFKSILKNKESIKYFKEISGERLVRPPKDFSPDFPDIELLKFKSYGFLHEVTNEQCLSTDFSDYVLKLFKLLSPMVKFLNRGLEM
ncbi:MAG: TIGR02453 family protein [Bacteroidetes bacterium HGW-Bacteroidetes-17]|jgi:uncharacterized protein (TIGR02453 family)|nr:MAG: TIGR02453 family protein [Bacteroidetes bacterium HGW-Bacteroidetes-17]